MMSTQPYAAVFKTQQTVSPAKSFSYPSLSFSLLTTLLLGSRRCYRVYSSYFKREVDVYTAEGDEAQSRLYRAATLAEKTQSSSNMVGMYLSRHRYTDGGIYEASMFLHKPSGRSGLKVGGYFVSEDACSRFEHYLATSSRSHGSRRANSLNANKRRKPQSKKLLPSLSALNASQVQRFPFMKENQRSQYGQPGDTTFPNTLNISPREVAGSPPFVHNHHQAIGAQMSDMHQHMASRQTVAFRNNQPSGSVPFHGNNHNPPFSNNGQVSPIYHEPLSNSRAWGSVYISSPFASPQSRQHSLHHREPLNDNRTTHYGYVYNNCNQITASNNAGYKNAAYSQNGQSSSA